MSSTSKISELFDSSFLLLLLVWLLFGALHAVASNYEFPTESERTLWRVSSLTLTGSIELYFLTVSVATIIFGNLARAPGWLRGLGVLLPTLIGVIARACLVAAMLASLRSLPPSAYETIPWTNYIPHL